MYTLKQPLIPGCTVTFF